MMKPAFFASLSRGRKLPLWGLALALVVGWLLLHHLGILTGGLSATEVKAATDAVGWHGIYNDPLYLPLDLVRSAVFFLAPDHGQLLTRLPNVLFGALAIIGFGWLVRLWHGARIATLATILFATSAWVLHVSRLASFDVLYLLAVPALLLPPLLKKKYPVHLAWIRTGTLVGWASLLYIPGLVWLVVLNLILQHRFVTGCWHDIKHWWQRALYVLAGLIGLAPLILHLTRSSGNVVTWLGLPHQLGTATETLRRVAEIPVNLFYKGPLNPELWLGRAPLLDVFALAVCALGIYFYVRHWRSIRSHLLAAFFVSGTVLAGLGGPVSLSLLIPLLYLAVATGLAYLLHEWYAVFPHNPLARNLGLGLLILAVSFSCLYQTRAYFVAWPHNPATHEVFRFHR